MLGQLLCCGLQIYLVIWAHVSLALCPNCSWRMWCYMQLPIAFWDNQQISLADSTECSVVGRITGKCCDINTVFRIGPSINTPLRLKANVPCLPVSTELPDIPCHIRHVSEVTISFEPLVDCLRLVLATKSVFLSLCRGFKSVTVSRIYVKVRTLPLGYLSMSSNSNQSLIVCSQRGPSHIHSSALTHGAIHSGHFSQFGWVSINEGPESRLLATLVVIARAVVIFGGLERGMEGGSWAAGGGEGGWVGIGGTDINELQGDICESWVFLEVESLLTFHQAWRDCWSQPASQLQLQIFCFKWCCRSLSSHTSTSVCQFPHALGAIECHWSPKLPDPQLRLVQEMKPCEDHRIQGHEWPQRLGCQCGPADQLVQEFRYVQQQEARHEPAQICQEGGWSWHEKVG